MVQRLEKIEEITERAKREGEGDKGAVKAETVVEIGDGNTNCNIYYNRRFEDRHQDGHWMVDCPNCGRRVSQKATSCPGCSHPVALHFQKLALQKMVKGLAVSLVGVVAATLALSQTAASPFLSFAVFGNLIILGGACHALSKIPPHV